MLTQAILVGLVGAFGGLDYQLGTLYAFRPIVLCPLVGLVLGDLQSGLAIGASLELLFMGSISIGAYVPPNETIGGVLAWIFKPLGWGNWQAAVASITGLVAKENIVGTLGILYGGGDGSVYQNIAAAFNGISGYSFLVFNLLCAPCFAAIGAIKREMNSRKWTWFAIGYQCGFAYLCGLMIYQFGCAFTGNLSIIGLICAILALAGIIYMLVRPYKEATTLKA